MVSVLLKKYQNEVGCGSPLFGEGQRQQSVYQREKFVFYLPKT